MDDKDFSTISANDFGASLRGIGLNLLVQDVRKSVEFLTQIFGMTAHQPTQDFAIMMYNNQVFQLHADHTYHSHPLLGMLPETPPRGAGVELRLYDSDPDAACDRAAMVGGHILAAPQNKPHGLREAFIADSDGYVWVPSRPLTQDELI